LRVDNLRVDNLRVDNLRVDNLRVEKLSYFWLEPKIEDEIVLEKENID
jgi:hypothetical protein